MGTRSSRRRILVIGLFVCLLLLFLALGALNAFNLPLLTPASPTQTLVFIGLSTLGFLLFVSVLVALVRNFLKLYADQRSHVLGTRLRTRMLWGAVLVSVVPLVFMFTFSYLLMNRAVDRWFSQPVVQMRGDADALANDLFHYAELNARAEADSIAAALPAQVAAAAEGSKPGQISIFDQEMQHHTLTLQGGFAILYRSGALAGSFQASGVLTHRVILKSLSPASTDAEGSPEAQPAFRERSVEGAPALLAAAQQNDEAIYSIGARDYTLATAGTRGGSIVLVGLPIPAGISEATLRLRNGADAYWALYRERREVRGLYMVLLLLTTLLAMLACVWLALNLSKQVTRPVEFLADAMEAIAEGDYAHRVDESSTEELGELSQSFNAMAADLESSRELADRSSAQLNELNAALQARRRELETLIETIPNGVVTLSPSRQIVLANRAFSELLDPGGQKAFFGTALSEVFAPEVLETLDRLLRRSHRMGSAAAEMEMHTTAGPRQISATVSLLEDGHHAGHDPLGYVLVLEDVTELLRAQKQSAWKEVARRVAHEIKNPLTPIALNAELIRRHMDRLAPLLDEAHIESRSPAVIQRSTEVINSSVEIMRSLVDQFSALAEFPAARPRPADLNAIVENSLALFAGRLGSIRVRCELAAQLPLVFADPNALQRALSNLIDNAAEAMHDSLLRELTISTRLLETGMVELVIADTGSGLTDEMRERLFLPYFSTKQRGTGLGLSIAAKIIQEHQGNIRAEKNVPAGARFILELQAASDADDVEDAAQPPEGMAAA